MSELHARITEDMKSAMRAKDKERLGVIRMLLSAIKDRQIETRAEVGDDEVQKILMSYAKKRREAQAEAQKAGRDDLAAKEQFELDLVSEYLPAALSDEELDALVAAAVAEAGATTMREMGAVMKIATAKAEGRADGSRISAAVKKRLAG